MKDIIYNSTVLIPELICERALCELYDAEKKYNTKIPVPKFGEIIDAIVPELVEKADSLYANHDYFKREITSSDQGKEKLSMYFKHWAYSLIKKHIN